MLFAIELTDISEFISRVGFPIAISVGLLAIVAWLGKKLIDSVTRNINTQTDVMPKIGESIDKVNDNLSAMHQQLGAICKANCQNFRPLIERTPPQ